MTTPTREEAAVLLYREASFLDRQMWTEWLAMYTDDCSFWVPAWRSEHETTRDPRTEASLIFAQGKHRLVERATRIQEGKTPTAQPLPRTLHLVSNVLVVADDSANGCRVDANWTVHRYNVYSGITDILYGRYEYVLRRRENELLIASKKVHLLNDLVSTYIDFFCV